MVNFKGQDEYKFVLINVLLLVGFLFCNLSLLTSKMTKTEDRASTVPDLLRAENE